MPKAKIGEWDTELAEVFFEAFMEGTHLGEWFGWDDAETSIGSRVPTLRDRLPPDLREGAAANFSLISRVDFGHPLFAPVCLRAAAERWSSAIPSGRDRRQGSARRTSGS